MQSINSDASLYMDLRVEDHDRRRSIIHSKYTRGNESKGRYIICSRLYHQQVVIYTWLSTYCRRIDAKLHRNAIYFTEIKCII